MKKLVAVLILLLSVTGAVYAKEYTVKKELEDINVTMNFDRNPPVSGENQVQVSLQDKKGASITDATVVVEYSMPAMPGMPAMSNKSATELKNKEYTATIDFMMSGAWTVTIKITRAGKTQSAKFNVDVG
jgi:hypothetical protein